MSAQKAGEQSAHMIQLISGNKLLAAHVSIVITERRHLGSL